MYTSAVRNNFNLEMKYSFKTRNKTSPIQLKLEENPIEICKFAFDEAEVQVLNTSSRKLNTQCSSRLLTQSFTFSVQAIFL